MSYKLFNIKGEEIKFKDLQNKGFWCKHGETKENVFVNIYGKRLNLIINPDKIDDIYAPDLFNTKTGRIGDLKTQNTPFFEAQKRYNIDPQYAVTFNDKDRIRYNDKYPNVEIYFAVDWQAIRMINNGIEYYVQPMFGVWFIPFESLNKIISNAYRHEYIQRTNDKSGNAKESYILNLNDEKFTRII